ncbi:MAG: ROK family transcriptional regulator [Caldilineae bacterium]|nr:MAG: ROK family transcriptional regulator [Caldilineae bacterium]
MPSLAGKNRADLKAHNLQAILMSLLSEERIARVELARRTALSATTISNLVGELMELGIIEEDGARPQAAMRGVGRPRRMLRLVPDARYVIGVHIGIGLYRVAVTNLYAEICANTISQYDTHAPAEEVLDAIAGDVKRTLEQSGVTREKLLGVGVGASGLVNPNQGVNLYAPRLGWRQTPIRAYLEERVQMPVCVENNVRAMALGEALFGAGRGARTLAFVYGRIGVGAGLVINGRLFRGSGFGAGEIGHMIMMPEGGERCSCGKHGCLETLVCEPVLVRAALRLTGQEPTGLLASYLRNVHDAPLISNIFAAARDGDAPTQALIRDRARYLGIALANLVNLYNPDRIILGGMFAEGSDLILPTAEAVMRAMALDSLGESVQVLPTSFGWRAGIIGAAAVALLNFFYAPAEGA